MSTQRPHIDEILTAFLSAQLKNKTGLRRRRIVTAEVQLRRCMETDGHRILTDGDRSVLKLEQEISPESAFARTMFADDLLFALGIYVSEPWLLPDRIDRDVQLRFAEALSAQLISWRLIDQWDLSCAILEVRGSIRRAKLEQRARTRTPR
ncbi:hypothetical protein [Microbacterium aerolatum]|uniref:hypothetical protein n=1 Tax=Microbacterium aerolatum TaxID=153731 RepID=UPI0038507155